VRVAGRCQGVVLSFLYWSLRWLLELVVRVASVSLSERVGFEPLEPRYSATSETGNACGVPKPMSCLKSLIARAAHRLFGTGTPSDSPVPASAMLPHRSRSEIDRADWPPCRCRKLRFERSAIRACWWSAAPAVTLTTQDATRSAIRARA